MIRKLLIANRGEIAVRAIRAARELGIGTVAVYSAPDAEALHVRMADRAIALAGSTARETYLDSRKIIAAAIQTGSDAVYPGYGFLAENSSFAAAVIKAGLIFVGPPPQVIDLMGDKDRARKTAVAHGVPVIPGSSVDEGVEGIARLVERVGCPIMIKAVAGGSGRGMRIVRDPAELDAKIGEAQREAESAFGNGQVIAEQFLEHPRHIEVQVFGDNHGNVIHFGERDCSTQRRNQKLVEESPAPNLDPQLRSQILESAVKLASAVGYVGAGTVECIVPASADRFFFLEMNTRIQVEHPVTELVSGVDLVALQLRVAGGEDLSLRQEDVRFSGHAIEYRIYAEQPEKDFRPALGRIEYMLRPGGIGVREDSWAEAGTVISPYYDSLISKVIVSGRSRSEAVARSRRVLDEYVIDGVDSTLPFHRVLVRHSDFQSGLIDVGWIGRNYSNGSINGNKSTTRPSAVGPIEVPRRKSTEQTAVKKKPAAKSNRSSKPAATKATTAAGRTKARLSKTKLSKKRLSKKTRKGSKK